MIEAVNHVVIIAGVALDDLADRADKTINNKYSAVM